MPPAHELTAPSPRVPALAVPRVAVRYRVALAVLALTALTFLAPSAPTYDPWAWIVWGREILHLDLSTVDGPSWKPLPVLLDDAVRALRRPRAGPVAVRRPRRRRSPASCWLFRLARRLGGLPAGVAAAVAYALAPWTLRNGGAGQLRGPARRAGAAADRTPARRRAAVRPSCAGSAPRSCAPRPGRCSASTACGCCGASRAARRLVAGGLRGAPALWLLPELVGLGRPAARRAPRPQPARQQRRLRRRPGPRGLSTSSTRCSPRRCGSASGRWSP